MSFDTAPASSYDRQTLELIVKVPILSDAEQAHWLTATTCKDVLYAIQEAYAVRMRREYKTRHVTYPLNSLEEIP